MNPTRQGFTVKDSAGKEQRFFVVRPGGVGLADIETSTGRAVNKIGPGRYVIFDDPVLSSRATILTRHDRRHLRPQEQGPASMRPGEGFGRDHALETYKSLVQISLQGLKLLALLNGGAAVALLAYLGNIAGKGMASPDMRWPMTC